MKKYIKVIHEVDNYEKKILSNYINSNILIGLAATTAWIKYFYITYYYIWNISKSNMSHKIDSLSHY